MFNEKRIIFPPQVAVLSEWIIHGVDSPGLTCLHHSWPHHHVWMEHRSSPAPFCLLKAASALYRNLLTSISKVTTLNLSLLPNLFTFCISLGFVLFGLFYHCHYAAWLRVDYFVKLAAVRGVDLIPQRPDPLSLSAVQLSTGKKNANFP